LAARLALSSQRLYSNLDDADDIPFRPDFLMGVYPYLPLDVAIGLSEVAGNMPPTFIAIAEDDPCAPAKVVSDWFFKMKAAGGPRSELHVYESGGHGMGACTTMPQNLTRSVYGICSWTERAASFIKNIPLGGTQRAVDESRRDLERRHPRFAAELAAARLDP